MRIMLGFEALGEEEIEAKQIAYRPLSIGASSILGLTLRP